MTPHKVIEDKLLAWGHVNVLGTHASTIEITCTPEISRRANCVIGVSATKGLAAVSPDFKKLARSVSTEIVITLESQGKTDTVRAWGSPELTFSHKQDIVIRTSNFVCPRTLAIEANKAAADLNRALIQKLQANDASLNITIVARQHK